MNTSEKIAAAKPSRNLVWMKHESMLDPDGHPVVIQVPQHHVQAYADQGYKAMNDMDIS